MQRVLPSTSLPVVPSERVQWAVLIHPSCCCMAGSTCHRASAAISATRWKRRLGGLEPCFSIAAPKQAFLLDARSQDVAPATRHWLNILAVATTFHQFVLERIDGNGGDAPDLLYGSDGCGGVMWRRDRRLRIESSFTVECKPEYCFHPAPSLTDNQAASSVGQVLSFEPSFIRQRLVSNCFTVLSALLIQLLLSPAVVKQPTRCRAVGSSTTLRHIQQSPQQKILAP